MNIEKYMKEYNALSDKDKIHRLEVIAQCYTASLDSPNWKESPFLDATKYWCDFENSLDEDVDSL